MEQEIAEAFYLIWSRTRFLLPRTKRKEKKEAHSYIFRLFIYKMMLDIYIHIRRRYISIGNLDIK